MTAQQRELAERLFEAAAVLPREQQSSFLAENCPDPEVRTEVESLLAFQTEGLPEGVNEAISRTAASVAAGVLIGRRAGAYQIVDRIGQGGMGTVYRAVRADGQFQQTVAVKTLRFAESDEASLERFRRERQILAGLEHPNIARLLDGGSWVPPGATESQPYLVMEYVDGVPLTVYCSRHKLSVRERVILFRRVCDAVSYAHQRLVVHRDIKPFNILVNPDGTPKLLDFGIAKLLDSDMGSPATVTQWRAMTPDYASPEQARGEPVSTATDVYSLGAVLYELLTGRRPREVSGHAPLHPSSDFWSREVEPPSASGRRELRGDLDVIVLKAMQPEPARRYPSVEQLSQDLQRYLEGRAIQAHADTWAYRTIKFVRRHAIGAAAAAALLLALLGGVAASSLEARRASRAERAALVERDRATAAERAAERDRDSALRAEQTSAAERNKALTEKRRADLEAATAKAVNEFLQTDLLAQAGSGAQAARSFKPDPDLKVRTALERAAAHIGGRFDSRPLVEAAVRETIADAFKQLGAFPEAERQEERVLQIRRSVLGQTHTETFNAMNRLAVLEWLQKKYAESEHSFKAILQMERKALGEEHELTLKTMGDLGGVLRDGQKYGEAGQLLTKALAINRRLYGEGRIETAAVMVDLARVYAYQGKYGEAETLFSSALDTLRRVRTEEHPDTLSTMNNLAVLYWRRGDFGHAENLFVELSAAVRRSLGEEHPDTLATLNNLATVYHSEGKYAEAEETLDRVLAVRRRVAGPDKPETLKTLGDIASLKLARGDAPQAESILIGVLDGLRRVYGDDHPDVLRTAKNLAVARERQGKYAESEELFSNLLERRRQISGGRDRESTPLLVALGRVRFAQQRYAEAEVPLREALRAYDAAAERGWERFHAEYLLGASLAGRKQYTEAEPLLIGGSEGLREQQAKIPAELQSIVEAADEAVSRLYDAWDKPEKAAEWRDKLRGGGLRQASQRR